MRACAVSQGVSSDSLLAARGLWLVAAFAVAASAAPASALAQERRYAATHVPASLVIGTGFETLRAETRETCVAPTLSPTRAVQQVEFEMTHVESTSEVARMSAMSASAAFGVGLWSASAEASLLSTARRSEHTVRFLARVTVTNTEEYAATARLLDEFAALDRSALRERCGNGYVSATLTGGEFVALIEYDAASEAEAREFRSRIQVSQRVTGSGATAAVQGAFSQFSSSSRLHVRYSIRGATGSIPAQTPEDALRYALDFPALVQSSGQVFSFRVTPYPRGGSHFGTAREDQIARLADLMLNAQRRLDEYRAVIDHPEEYAFPVRRGSTRADDLSRLGATSSTLEGTVTSVRAAAERCMDYTVSACTVPAVTFHDLPSLPRRLSAQDAFGVSGGCVDWSDDGRTCERCEFTLGREYPLAFQALTEELVCPAVAAGTTRVSVSLPGVTTRDFRGDHLLQSGIGLVLAAPGSTPECNPGGNAPPCWAGSVTGRSHSLTLASAITTSATSEVSARLQSQQCIAPDRCTLLLQPGSTIGFDTP